MEEINEYLKTVENELNEIQTQINSNPESANQYESRLEELMDELITQFNKIKIK